MEGSGQGRSRAELAGQDRRQPVLLQHRTASHSESADPGIRGASQKARDAFQSFMDIVVNGTSNLPGKAVLRSHRTIMHLERSLKAIVVGLTTFKLWLSKGNK